MNRFVVAIGTHRPWSLSGLLEAADDAIALGGRGVDRDEIVVVEVDAPGAELAQALDGDDRIDLRPDDLAERIATAVADGPEAKGELVRWGRSESIGLHASMIVSLMGSGLCWLWALGSGLGKGTLIKEHVDQLGSACSCLSLEP